MEKREKAGTVGFADTDHDPFIEDCLNTCWDEFRSNADCLHPGNAERLLKERFRKNFEEQMQDDATDVWKKDGPEVIRMTAKMAGYAMDFAKPRKKAEEEDIRKAIEKIRTVACIRAANSRSQNDELRIQGGWCAPSGVQRDEAK